MTISSVTRFGATVVFALIGMGPAIGIANADDALNAQLDSLRQALAKYEDPYVAVRDLYLSTVGCVHYDGSKMDGHMDYPKGAMGIHFVNLTVQGPLDPMKPNVLIYEPVDGRLKLVAAEWPGARDCRQGTPKSLRPTLPGPDGRPRTAHTPRVPPL
jgi:hypothetical protein